MHCFKIIKCMVVRFHALNILNNVRKCGKFTVRLYLYVRCLWKSLNIMRDIFFSHAMIFPQPKTKQNKTNEKKHTNRTYRTIALLY